MVGLFINTVPLRVQLNSAARSASTAAPCNAIRRYCANTVISVMRSCGHWAGVGEMYDSLLA